MKKSNATTDLHLVAWEITRRCMMDCKHCRAGEKPLTADHELSTSECLSVIDDITSFASPIIMLTGGDPLFREDLPVIVQHMAHRGVPVTLSTCGPLVSEEKLSLLKDAGLGYISFSIDAINSSAHDAFRGYFGAFRSAINGIGTTRKVGLDFAVLTTVTKYNYRDLPRILELASDLGASFFIPFFLVPMGTGRNLRQQQISPEEYEECLNWLYTICEGKGSAGIRKEMVVKPGCAPHFYRIVSQREKSYELKFFSTDIREGCLAGFSFLFISHVGTVQPCGYLELECGNLRKESLASIWSSSDVFQQIRNINGYHGRCARCEFLRVCRGCRARAFAETGDFLNEDPYCSYSPQTRKRPSL